MREPSHLRARYRIIAAAAGMLWMPTGVVMALPALIALARLDEAPLVGWFVGPGLALTGCGWLLWRRSRPLAGAALSTSEGAVVVAVTWVGAVLVGALPLIGAARLDLTRAVFESASAWTTTGLSVVDVTRAPWSVLLYRSTLQLCGGAGFVIMALAAVVGPSGTSLSGAEGRQDQLIPNVRRSARLVVRIYAAYAVAGWIALVAAGMGWFDAINHAFTAVSTGGFSTAASSIGHWDSPAVEAVILVLMLLGSTNFATAYAAFSGRLRSAFGSVEVRLVAVGMPVASALIFLTSPIPGDGGLARPVRVAVFEAASALTTTGFSTTSYGGWPAAPLLVLVLLMIIGGGSGSTAGGLKQYRVGVLGLAVRDELRRQLRPRGAVISSRVGLPAGRAALTQDLVRAAAVYASLYAGTLALGALVLCAHGLDLRDALFELASALGTVGLSVGVTSAGAADGVLWTMTAAMLLGRLEFFVLVVGLARLAIDIRRMMAPSQPLTPEQRRFFEDLGGRGSSG